MILGLIIVAVCFYNLGRAVVKVRDGAWTGPRTPAMRTRAARPRAARGPARGPGAWRMWHQAWSADWLAKRDHARVTGTARPARPARRPLAGRVRLRPRTVADPPAGGSRTGWTPLDDDPPAAPARPWDWPEPPDDDPPAAPAGGRPPPEPPEPSTTSSPTNGGTTMPTGTSTAAGEKITEGANELHAHA